MSINEIIGNDKIIERFKNAVNRDELSHAYIFEGPEGIGKKTIAIEYAAMIMCTSTDGDKPCGNCPSCLKIKSGNHPDLFLETPKKKEYSVEEISDIQKEMRRKPNESNKKIFIIDEGQRLSVKSQNKFLKTIEEPSENVITIILVDNINRLLKTTVSRVQHIKVKEVSYRDMRTYFEKRNYSRADIELAINFASGNIGKAKKIIEDEDFKEIRQSIIGIIDDIIFKDRTKIFSNMKFFEEKKEYIVDILDIIETWFRDVMIIKKDLAESHIVNRDKLEALKTQSERLSIDKIYDIVKRAESTKRDLDRNVNYQLAIEMFLLNIG